MNVPDTGSGGGLLFPPRALLLARELQMKRGPDSQISGPSLVATPQTGVAPTDVLGAFGLQQAALQNAYNARAARASSDNNALAGVGGSALLAAALLGSQK